MSRNTVEQIIRRFGSQQRVAELLGIWQTAVSGWVRRGAIPTRRQEELLRSPDARVSVCARGLLPPRREAAGRRTVRTGGPPRAPRRLPPRSHPSSASVYPLTVNPRHRQPESRADERHRQGHPAHGRRQARAGRGRARQGPVRGRRDPAARPRAGQHVRLGDPQASATASRARPCSRRWCRPPTLDSDEVPGHGDGRGRQLQRRLGGARQAGLAVRRPQAAATTSRAPTPSGIVWAVGSKVKRWKVGDEVVIHCNQDDGDDEECNGGDPMNSPSPADLGLRDPGRLVRAVLPGAVAPADAAAPAPDLGGGGCYVLTLATAYRMLFGHPPHAPQARRQCAGLGRGRRPRLDGDPADRRLGRQRDRGDLGRGQARVRDVAGRQGCDQPQASSTAGARCRTPWTSDGYGRG